MAQKKAHTQKKGERPKEKYTETVPRRFGFGGSGGSFFLKKKVGNIMQRYDKNSKKSKLSDF